MNLRQLEIVEHVGIQWQLEHRGPGCREWSLPAWTRGNQRPRILGVVGGGVCQIKEVDSGAVLNLIQVLGIVGKAKEIDCQDVVHQEVWQLIKVGVVKCQGGGVQQLVEVHQDLLLLVIQGLVPVLLVVPRLLIHL